MCTNQPERVSALLSQLKRTSDHFEAGMANAAPPTPVSSTPLSPAAAGAGGGPSTSLPSRFYVSAKQKALSAQAQWFVYSKQTVSQATFKDPYFKEMLSSMGSYAAGQAPI